MSLNLQNYVSSPDKKPYCKAHVPKAGFTVVSETPEAKRIAEVTKNQSNLAYTADFVKDKAQFTVSKCHTQMILEWGTSIRTIAST